MVGYNFCQKASDKIPQNKLFREGVGSGLTLDSILHSLKLLRGLMTWIFIYSGQISKARNPLMDIINLSVSIKFSLLNFKIKTFTMLVPWRAS